jgi:hypothetical protein
VYRNFAINTSIEEIDLNIFCKKRYLIFEATFLLDIIIKEKNILFSDIKIFENELISDNEFYINYKLITN